MLDGGLKTGFCPYTLAQPRNDRQPLEHRQNGNGETEMSDARLSLAEPTNSTEIKSRQRGSPAPSASSIRHEPSQQCPSERIPHDQLDCQSRKTCCDRWTCTGCQAGFAKIMISCSCIDALSERSMRRNDLANISGHH